MSLERINMSVKLVSCASAVQNIAMATSSAEIQYGITVYSDFDVNHRKSTSVGGFITFFVVSSSVLILHGWA